MKTTLTDLLKRFDEWYVENNGKVVTQEQAIDYENLRKFLTQSIKDALEAVRVDKKVLDGSHFDVHNNGFNNCTTQYDENVKAFLGEEKI